MRSDKERRVYRAFRRASLACALAFAPCFTLTAQGQPQPVEASSSKADQSAYDSMIKQQAPLETTDPAAALAMLQEFGRNHPRLNPDLRVTLLSQAAYLSNNKLKDGAGALEIANQSLQEAQSAVEAGASDFLLARATLVKGHLLILNDQREAGEALLGSGENFARFARLLSSPSPFERSYGDQAVELLISTYEQTQRPTEAIAKLEELVRLNPSVVATNRAHFIEHMSSNLLVTNQTEAALSWGKLRYMLAQFDEAAIASSTQLLSSAWTKSGDLSSLGEFSRAQSGDTSVKNPLASIALPAVVGEMETVKALNQLTEKGEKKSRVRNAISAYILMGQWLPAMQRAQGVWLGDPKSAAGPQEIGRVFKATDLSATRGNAFVAYVNGNGEENPLEAFLRQHAADGAGATGIAPVSASLAPASLAPVGMVSTIKAKRVNAGLSLAIVQLSQGQLTPQQAWDQKLLDADDIVQLLSRPRRLTPDESNERLKRDLAGLLVRYASATVANPGELSARARLELAHYYSEQGDARAVPLCEALISEKLDGKQLKIPTGKNAEPDNVSLWLGAVIYLAKYYEKVGQWQQASETWERALTFWQDVSWWQSSVRIEAARAYIKTGQNEKAKTLYAQVPQFGDGWFAGLAIYDQVQPLLAEGKIASAQALLELPLTNIPNEAAQVLLLATRSQAYYKSGDWEKARRDSRDALSRFKALKPSQLRSGVETVANTAERRLAWSEQWLKSPFDVETRTLHLTWRKGASKEQHRFQVLVRSPRPLSLQVQSNTSAVDAQVKEQGKQTEYFWQQEVTVEVQPDEIKGAAEVRITSPDAPDFIVKVPVTLDVQNAIVLSNPTAFFGEVAMGKTASTSLKFSSLAPFRIVSVTPNDVALQVQGDFSQPALQHTLQLAFTPLEAGRFYSGTLRIQTDVPGEEVMQVPFVARSP